jgi:hypothetical protein
MPSRRYRNVQQQRKDRLKAKTIARKTRQRGQATVQMLPSAAGFGGGVTSSPIGNDEEEEEWFSCWLSLL